MDWDFETIQLIQEEFQNDFISPHKENTTDAILARQLQEQFRKEDESKYSKQKETHDISIARSLQQFEDGQKANTSYGDLVYEKKNQKTDFTKSLVDPSWEIIDPTPDIHVLFMAFNNKFFWGKLDSVCVSWSKRMKRCAGICAYHGAGGLCSITLSEPLLKLRPRKDLIETLLHEMIHALLFVTHNNKDRDGHGPEFHKHMYRINKEAGTNITVYHSFHDEVELYLTHWWRCDGPCQKWKPYFGIVRRSSNRAPGPYDRWWGMHSRSCGGTFIKIKSPEPKVKAPKKTKNPQPNNDIRKFVANSGNSKTNGVKSNPKSKVIPSNGNSSNIHNVPKSNTGLSTSVTISSKTNNIHGFSNSTGKTVGKGQTKLNSNTIVVTKKPSTNTQDKKADSPFKIGAVNKIKAETENKNNSDGIDYSIVRNHWINKFSNSQPSGSLKTNISNKRKSLESTPVPQKVLKVVESSSQDSIDLEYADCPVCNVNYPIEQLNRHLDICLSKQQNECKECIICLNSVKLSEYTEHVDECLKKNFGDEDELKNKKQNKDVIVIEDDDVLDSDYINCKICQNKIQVGDLEEHLTICKNRTECPECGEKLDPSRFDIHLADCLMKKFDQMDDFSSDQNGENKSDKPEQSDSEEKITCLVCGTNILKVNLYSHLDECMKEIFDKAKEPAEIKEDDEDSELYNCPFCMKLIAEIHMSEHIDVCLKTHGDAEAEENKNLFLSEID